MEYGDDRFWHLQKTGERLTPEEMAEGWHYCWEWDGLLVCPDFPEWGHDGNTCSCGFSIPHWGGR